MMTQGKEAKRMQIACTKKVWYDLKQVTGESGPGQYFYREEIKAPENSSLTKLGNTRT